MQELLGHESVSMTGDIYLHVLKDEKGIYCLQKIHQT
jgi:hypothetical protein